MLKISQTTDVSNSSDKIRLLMREKRLLSLARKQLKDAKNNAYYEAYTSYPDYLAAGGRDDFNKFSRKYKFAYIDARKNEIDQQKAKVLAAKSDIADSPLLYDLGALKQEAATIQAKLKAYKGDRVLKLRGKNVAAMDFAAQKAFRLDGCSSLLIFKESKNARALKYRNGCKDRSCPVCGHFHARTVARSLQDQIRFQLTSMDKLSLLRGRLVHMVLTVQNVDADRVLEIKKSWRKIQKEKKREYKSRKNEYGVWDHLKWGVWKFEATRNENGLWHPHLHVLGWVDGWLAHSKVSRAVYTDYARLRRVKIRARNVGRIKQRGWWIEMQKAWKKACATVGLHAAVNGSREIAGAKVQHLGGVLSFNKQNFKSRMDRLDEILGGATAEIAKYTAKSQDLASVEDPYELIGFLASIHGQQLMAGFGGLKVVDEDEDEDEEEETEEMDVETREVIYIYGRSKGGYVKASDTAWSDDTFAHFLERLSDFKLRNMILLELENRLMGGVVSA